MKVFGIPVRIEPSFLLIGAFLASSRITQPIFLLEWLGVLFVSVLIHEFGHAAAVRFFGQQPEIILHSMGGLTTWQEEQDEVRPIQHILISLSGPAAGFAFGGAVFFLGKLTPGLFDSKFAEVTYSDLLWVNLGWGLLNLLPILPLDGGNVVANLETLVTKKKNGLIARAVSLVFALILGLLALSTGWLWAAFLMALFAYSNGVALLQYWQARRDRLQLPQFEQAVAAVRDQNGAEAIRLATEISSQAKSDGLKMESSKLLAQGYLLENQLPQARESLERIMAIYGPGIVMEVFLGVPIQLWPRFIPLIESAYKSSHSPELGGVLAQGLIEAGRFDEAGEVIADPRQDAYALQLYTRMQLEAFRVGRYETSIEAGRSALERGGDHEVAYHISQAYARLGRWDESLEWVNRAVDAGMKESEILANDPNMNEIRSRPEFESIYQRLRKAEI
jgi:Zn-dependent protease